MIKIWRGITCSNVLYNLIFTTKFNDSSIFIINVSIGLFEFVVADWICWWRHNTNPGCQVQPIFLQANQPIRMQYSDQIKIFLIIGALNALGIQNLSGLSGSNVSNSTGMLL